MVGCEYLDKALLQFLWARLNSQFSKEISDYQGTVEQFINSYSPQIHLIGRIYFHLG